MRTLQQIAEDFLNPKITVTPLPADQLPDDVHGISLKFGYLGKSHSIFVTVNGGWDAGSEELVQARIMTAIQQHIYKETVNNDK